MTFAGTALVLPIILPKLNRVAQGYVLGAFRQAQAGARQFNVAESSIIGIYEDWQAIPVNMARQEMIV